MGRRGSASSSRGDLAALWGPQQELAMQGSWESLAALLGNPLPPPVWTPTSWYAPPRLCPMLVAEGFF